jgi:GDP-4-dehydro-6-deoxy-D-mannose reductase
MRDAGSHARLLFASSAFVYGVTGPDEQPLSEDRPLRPLTPYGASKVASEAIVTQRDRSGTGESVIARAFQHTGPGHVGAYALADWACQIAEIEAGRRSGPIRCGNLDVERDYLDVRDVAAGYLAAGTAGGAGEIYNIASGAPSSMRFLLESLIEAFGVDVEIEVDAARMRSVDQPRVYGDASKLRRDTGWAPAVDIRRSLADLAVFWRRRVAEEREPAAT